MTVPLGVLKKGSVAFSPPLPACKRASIARLGMGVEDKIALVFKPSDIFWDRDTSVSGHLTTRRKDLCIFNALRQDQSSL